MPKTKVILTTDIEFQVAGAFTDPSRFKPIGEQAVLAREGGRELGLGYMLETLGQRGVKGTFFVEVLNTHYFGLEPMGRIARRIHEAGHDVQMHMHPCWMAFDGGRFVRQPGSPPPNDSCGAIAVPQLVELMERGLEIFKQWGLPRPIALRTGSFSVGLQVYEAQRIVGIPIASNVCLAVCEPQEASLQLHSGRRVFSDVIEVPNLTFQQTQLLGSKRRRAMQITAASGAEMRLVMDRANAAGVDSLVAVTHAFEFFKRPSVTNYSSLRPNRVNQSRLEALCRHVSKNGKRFEWSTFAEMAPHWQKQPVTPDKVVSSSPLLALGRTAANLLNDAVWLA